MGCRRHNHHRVPLAVLVDPETLARIRAIKEEGDRRWSRGRILDRAIQIAEAELMEEASDRELIVVALSPKTERDLGLLPPS